MTKINDEKAKDMHDFYQNYKNCLKLKVDLEVTMKHTDQNSKDYLTAQNELFILTKELHDSDILIERMKNNKDDIMFVTLAKDAAERYAKKFESGFVTPED